jgi:hypothetical protein
MSITGEGATESAAFADAIDLGRVLIILGAADRGVDDVRYDR